MWLWSRFYRREDELPWDLFLRSDVAAKSRCVANDMSLEVRGQDWRRIWVLRDCSRLNNGPHDVSILIPRIGECTVSGQRDFLQIGLL